MGWWSIGRAKKFVRLSLAVGVIEMEKGSVARGAWHGAQAINGGAESLRDHRLARLANSKGVMDQRNANLSQNRAKCAMGWGWFQATTGKRMRQRTAVDSRRQMTR